VGKFIWRAPHHYSPPPPLPVATKREARELLGLHPNRFLVASFGLVSRAKRIDRALLGFRRFLERGADAQFLVVGEVQKGYRLEELTGLSRFRDRVLVTGRQPMDRFYLYMLAADVVVNLRFPSAGELSGTLIRTLGMGKAVLVSNTGPFVEFPEHVVARVDLGPPEVSEIAGTLAWLHRHPELREAMGRFAKEHVEAHYKLSDEAAAYAEFLRKVADARERGELRPPPPYDQADLAAAVAASIGDLPLGRLFGLENVREALRDATGHQT
jgi:glycosyltransferase involved in cell wall biosynthesis